LPPQVIEFESILVDNNCNPDHIENLDAILFLQCSLWNMDSRELQQLGAVVGAVIRHMQLRHQSLKVQPIPIRDHGDDAHEVEHSRKMKLPTNKV
jgi:hypothetical protein